MVPSFLAEGGCHEGEQREPEGDKHTHIAQTVVAVQLVHQKDLKRHKKLMRNQISLEQDVCSCTHMEEVK